VTDDDQAAEPVGGAMKPDLAAVRAVSVLDHEMAVTDVDTDAVAVGDVDSGSG
jgi:hypothetical protein